MHKVPLHWRRVLTTQVKHGARDGLLFVYIIPPQISRPGHAGKAGGDGPYLGLAKAGWPMKGKSCPNGMSLLGGSDYLKMGYHQPYYGPFHCFSCLCFISAVSYCVHGAKHRIISLFLNPPYSLSIGPSIYCNVLFSLQPLPPFGLFVPPSLPQSSHLIAVQLHSASLLSFTTWRIRTSLEMDKDLSMVPPDPVPLRRLRKGSMRSVDDDKLRERKRALDRKAQRASREKTRSHIAHLEKTVRILTAKNGSLATSELMEEMAGLHAEIDRLKKIIGGIKSAISADAPEQPYIRWVYSISAPMATY
jgi:hypothetical protein